MRNLQIDPCTWVQCKQPPLPDGHNLKMNWNGHPVAFGTTVTYSCLPGFYFKHDRDQMSFEAVCRPTGYFSSTVLPWPSCIKGQ